MNKRQEDFLDLLMKQENLVTYAILITRGRKFFGGEEEEEALYWDHDTPVTIKEHEAWKRTDTDYAEQCEFIKEHVLDIIERGALYAVDKGNATVIQNILKTKLKHRGYTTDDNSVLFDGDVYVGFEVSE